MLSKCANPDCAAEFDYGRDNSFAFTAVARTQRRDRRQVRICTIGCAEVLRSTTSFFIPKTTAFWWQDTCRNCLKRTCQPELAKIAIL